MNLEGCRCFLYYMFELLCGGSLLDKFIQCSEPVAYLRPLRQQLIEDLRVCGGSTVQKHDGTGMDAAEKLGMLLVIHMDPIEMKNAQVLRIRAQAEEILCQIDEKCSIHDFRVVNGSGQINLIFDMVVPFEYKEDKKAELVRTFNEKIREVDQRYLCVITVEHSYIQEE